MLMSQHYSIHIPEDVVGKCRPGHLVYPDNESDDAVGFVYKVDGNLAEFVLFTPHDLSDMSEQLVEVFHMEPDEWASMLKDALANASKEVVEMWDNIEFYSN